MSKKEAYEQKFNARLAEWEAEIDKLKAKVSGASADARIKYHAEIESLESERDSMRKRLEEFRNTSGEAWEDVKDGLERAGDSLSASIKSAFSRFD